MENRYLPPVFGLYEFDAGPIFPGERRFFHGWNGPVGEPAAEVSLGWATDAAMVLVSSSSRRDEPAMITRLSAAHLALGGSRLPIESRPTPTAAVGREITRLSQATDLWSPGPALVPGGPASDVAQCDGFSLATTTAGPETILIAAVGVPAAQFQIRPVTDWAAYDLDATQPHSLAELSAGL